MIIEQQNSTAVISQDKTSISEFIKKFSVLHERFKENDVILHLKDPSKFSFDLLISISKTHRQSNYSLVIDINKSNENFEGSLR